MILILFNTIKYFYFLNSTTFKGQGKKMWNIFWSFGVWEDKIFCFRYLVTFFVSTIFGLIWGSGLGCAPRKYGIGVCREIPLIYLPWYLLTGFIISSLIQYNLVRCSFLSGTYNHTWKVEETIKKTSQQNQCYNKRLPNKWCLSTNTEGVLEGVRGAIGPKKFENQTPKNVSLHFMAIYPWFKFFNVHTTYVVHAYYVPCRINKQKKLEKGRGSQFERQFSHINACHS